MKTFYKARRVIAVTKWSERYVLETAASISSI